MKTILKPTQSEGMADAVYTLGDDVKVIKLSFDEIENQECSDNRYGCKCISYEKCCGCLMQ